MVTKYCNYILGSDCYRQAFSLTFSYLLICPARKFNKIYVKNKFTGIAKWSPSTTTTTKHNRFTKSQKPKNISHKIVGLVYFSTLAPSRVGKFVFIVVKRRKIFKGISENKRNEICVIIGIPMLSAKGG